MYYLINQCVKSHNDINAFSLEPGDGSKGGAELLKAVFTWSSTLAAEMVNVAVGYHLVKRSVL